DVQVNEKKRRLFAEQIYIYRDAQGEISSLEIPGSVLIEQPGARISGQNASIILDGQDTTLSDVHYRYYAQHARGSAEQVDYAQDEPILLYHANYTTCSPDSRVWQLQGDTVRLDQAAGRGEIYNTVLKIQDVPVFYSPYLNFPLDDRRQSGFLTPQFGSQTGNGFILTTPYYFNLAPNYDATFYPRYLSERGLQLGGEARYLDEYHQTELYGTYLNHDRGFAAFQAQQLSDPSFADPNDPRQLGVDDASDNRWDVAFTHIGQYDNHWSTYLDYNRASDDNYFNDLGTEIFTRDYRQLLQRAQVDYSELNYSATALVQNYQILQPFDNDLYNVPYQILPHLEADLMPETQFWHSYGAMNAQFTYFDHTFDPMIGEKPTIGARTHINPIIQMPLRRTYGYLLPAAEFRYTQYDLSLSPSNAAQDADSQINRSLPTVYVDGGLMFDRATHFMDKAYTQTLEPRLYYLYTPFTNQDEIPLFDTDLYDFNTDQL
ncbi:MAG TPA: LPS assembly protein LptD, partial [Gammaproteobacteria bacterium]|nr:LPS assembly protein LptD [Gammaproteobacteria bacterium]